MTKVIENEKIEGITEFSHFSEHTGNSVYYSYHGRLSPSRDDLPTWKPISEIHQEPVNYADEFREIFILNLSGQDFTVEYFDDKLNRFVCGLCESMDDCNTSDTEIPHTPTDVPLDFEPSNFILKEYMLCGAICGAGTDYFYIPTFMSTAQIDYHFNYWLTFTEIANPANIYATVNRTVTVNVPNSSIDLIQSNSDKRAYMASVILGNDTPSGCPLIWSAQYSVKLHISAMNNAGYQDKSFVVTIITEEQTPVTISPSLVLLGDVDVTIPTDDYDYYVDEMAHYSDDVYQAGDVNATGNDIGYTSYVDIDDTHRDLVYEQCGEQVIRHLTRAEPYCIIAVITNINVEEDL